MFEEFEEFVAARGQALQRVAYLLTGDWGLAEDLLQTALARAYPRWSRIERDNPEAYVRKIMSRLEQSGGAAIVTPVARESRRSTPVLR